MVKYYESNDFVENYSSYLKLLEIIKKMNPYHDPDAVDANNKAIDPNFYNDLCDFLNKSINIENLNFEFNGKKIDVKEKGKIVLTLTSDQFGFSVPKIEDGKLIAGADTPSSHYPYAKYIGVSTNKEKAIKLVVDTVYNTRTIGGSFLWPLVYGKSQLNINRGIKSYIEDCVDLTLFEIKKFYEYYKNPKSNYGTIQTKMNNANNNFLLLKYSDSKVIYEWLKYFGNFENYVTTFCFQPFVNEKYEVIDITKVNIEENNEYDFTYDNDKILTEDTVKKYQEIFYKKSSRIVSLKEEQLKKMLNNLKWLCIKRSTKMEEIIKQTEKK